MFNIARPPSLILACSNPSGQSLGSLSQMIHCESSHQCSSACFDVHCPALAHGSIWAEMVSKALAKSRKTTIVSFVATCASLSTTCNSTLASRHPSLCRNACWNLLKASCSRILCTRILCSALVRMDVTAIGRYSLGWILCFRDKGDPRSC